MIVKLVLYKTHAENAIISIGWCARLYFTHHVLPPPHSYSEKKGFHCLSVHKKFHCLGAGKGRRYPPMETADVAYLEDFYRHDNLLLRELLKKFSYRPPTWLTVS